MHYFNKMKKIKTRHKLLLILFGIILGLIVLELGLNLSASFLLSIQGFKNTPNYEDNEYKLLCLGDSLTKTTIIFYNNQSTWPEQLQLILDNKSTEMKFKVINEGLPGATSTKIVSNLERHLEKYKPNTVIVMMGLDEEAENVRKQRYGQSSRFFMFLKDLKTYKFINILVENINENIFKKMPEQKEPWKEIKGTGDYDNALRIHLISVWFNPHNIWNYLFIEKEDEEAYKKSEIWQKQVEEFEKKEVLFKSLIEEYPNKSWLYTQLATEYRDIGKFEEAEKMYEKAIDINSSNIWALSGFGELYRGFGVYDEAEKVFYEILEIDPAQDWVYVQLGKMHEELEEYEKAEEMYEKAHKIRMAYYNPVLLNNYHKLYDEVTSRGIKLVVMQYPTRDADELKNMFTREQQKNILFVNNEENFKKAIRNESYDAVFADMFAVTLGHSTLKGNRLTAQNVANVILKELNIENG